MYNLRQQLVRNIWEIIFFCCRMDEDQSARKNAQKYLKVVDPDYYEIEGVVLY